MANLNDQLLTWLLNPIVTTQASAGAGSNYSNITTAGTSTVKSGAGTLQGVIVNSKGTVASTITMYDNTSGTGSKIGTIDSLNLSGAFPYNVNFLNGLTIVTTGTVAPDITIIYK